MADLKVVIQAVPNRRWVERLGQLSDLQVVFADTVDDLRRELADADMMFGFDFRGALLPQAWAPPQRLRWIQWAGAGVDGLLFPGLVESQVVVTNATGVYDDAIAEHVLALIGAHAKGIDQSVRDGTNQAWNYRISKRVRGSSAAVVGAGGIGRAIARLIMAVGVQVEIYGTGTRPDPEFGHVASWADRQLSTVDWLILALPLTTATGGFVNPSVLAELSSSSVVINVGRGATVDEAALIDALSSGKLGGAALDVVAVEPLPEASPLWHMPNVIITPHHAGDSEDFPDRLMELFLDNLARFRSGLPMRGLVDKQRGYAVG